jgi:hypothetical protein
VYDECDGWMDVCLEGGKDGVGAGDIDRGGLVLDNDGDDSVTLRDDGEALREDNHD